MPRVNPDIEDLSLVEPFNRGWRREIVYRSDGTNRADVYYFYKTPYGVRKFRTTSQLIPYLTNGLTPANFSFSKKTILEDEPSFEIVRQAYPRQRCSLSKKIVRSRLVGWEEPRNFSGAPAFAEDEASSPKLTGWGDLWESPPDIQTSPEAMTKAGSPHLSGWGELWGSPPDAQASKDMTKAGSPHLSGWGDLWDSPSDVQASKDMTKPDENGSSLISHQLDVPGVKIEVVEFPSENIEPTSGEVVDPTPSGSGAGIRTPSPIQKQLWTSAETDREPGMPVITSVFSLAEPSSQNKIPSSENEKPKNSRRKNRESFMKTGLKRFSTNFIFCRLQRSLCELYKCQGGGMRFPSLKCFSCERLYHRECLSLEKVFKGSSWLCMECTYRLIPRRATAKRRPGSRRRVLGARAPLNAGIHMTVLEQKHPKRRFSPF